MTCPLKVSGVPVKVLEGIEETRRRAQEACQRKKRYSDEWAARAQGTFENESGHRLEQLYVYKCRWCRGWHLTRQQLGKQWAANYYTKDSK